MLLIIERYALTTRKLELNNSTITGLARVQVGNSVQLIDIKEKKIVDVLA